MAESVVTKQTTNCKLWVSGYPKFAATYREVGVTCPLSCILNPVWKKLGIDAARLYFNAYSEEELAIMLAGLGECYANKSHTGQHSKRAGTLSTTNWDILAEAKLARINVSGDILASGSGQIDSEFLTGLWQSVEANSALRAWMYTHAWRELSGSEFAGTVPAGLEILASVGSLAEREEAKALGYRTARVTTDPQSVQRGEVVCPEQTGKTEACISCGLCPGRKGVKGTRSDFVDLAVRPDIVFILH